MTKKDYELIAGAIKGEYARYKDNKEGHDARRALFNCANALSLAMQKNDKRSQSVRFMILCGVITCKGNHKTKSELFACADCNVIIDGNGRHV